MDIYNTYFMLAAIRELPVEHTFFKRRYFPTDTAMDVFGTSRVLADYKSEGTKRAPFVVPRIGALPVGREGFSTYELEPANIAISKPLTLDHLTQRGFGESLLSEMTPEDREQYFLMDDLADLSARISRTEEVLAVQTMINNGCTMRHLTDKADVYEDIGVQFYDGTNNPAQFTPSQRWTHSVYKDGTWTPGNWYYDIYRFPNAYFYHLHRLKFKLKKPTTVFSAVGFCLLFGCLLFMLRVSYFASVFFTNNTNFHKKCKKLSETSVYDFAKIVISLYIQNY